jgi:hypothetical protein
VTIVCRSQGNVFCWQIACVVALVRNEWMVNNGNDTNGPMLCMEELWSEKGESLNCFQAWTAGCIRRCAWQVVTWNYCGRNAATRIHDLQNDVFVLAKNARRVFCSVGLPLLQLCSLSCWHYEEAPTLNTNKLTDRNWNCYAALILLSGHRSQ